MDSGDCSIIKNCCPKPRQDTRAVNVFRTGNSRRMWLIISSTQMIGPNVLVAHRRLNVTLSTSNVNTWLWRFDIQHERNTVMTKAIMYNAWSWISCSAVPLPLQSKASSSQNIWPGGRSAENCPRHGKLPTQPSGCFKTDYGAAPGGRVGGRKERREGDKERGRKEGKKGGKKEGREGERERKERTMDLSWHSYNNTEHALQSEHHSLSWGERIERIKN